MEDKQQEQISRGELISEVCLGALALRSTHLTIYELKDLMLDLLKNKDVRTILMLPTNKKKGEGSYVG